MAHHALFIQSRAEALGYLKAIGASSPGIEYMIPKAVFRCIKLKDIPSRAANLIKQEMLAKGGEAAVAKSAVIGEGSSDVLLMGTLKQYYLLTEKLKLQPFGLRQVAIEIEAILMALESSDSSIKLAHGKELELGKRTQIMGILNVTPDSFSDGGRYLDIDKAVQHALEMRAEGADIIDVGGASSRPDSAMASAEEELSRILPVVKKLAQEDIIISIDTFRAEVARQALDNGAHLINDIGSLHMDAGLVKVLAEWQAPVVLMHNRMQINCGQPYSDLIADIIAELNNSIETAVEAGLAREQIIIDPGVGFGKTLAENRLLIKRLRDFKSMGLPLLLGTSRKSFIGHTLDLEVDERLEGSLATVAMAIMNGADIVRVHDVKASKRIAIMTDAVRNENG